MKGLYLNKLRRDLRKITIIIFLFNNDKNKKIRKIN